MEELEIYKGLREISVKQLAELKQKGSMSPAEAEAAKTAMCLIDMIDERVGGPEAMGEMSYGRYSRHGEYDQPYRRYNITAYADGRSMHGPYGYSEMYPMDDYSRRGSYEYRNRDSMGRYSSHSIDDRVVDMLEKMIDTAKSEYEHQKLMEYIRYVRSKEMGE